MSHLSKVSNPLSLPHPTIFLHTTTCNLFMDILPAALYLTNDINAVNTIESVILLFLFNFHQHLPVIDIQNAYFLLIFDCFSEYFVIFKPMLWVMVGVCHLELDACIVNILL